MNHKEINSRKGHFKQILFPCSSSKKQKKKSLKSIKSNEFFNFAELVYKTCLSSGRWEGRIKGSNDSPQGWTNYTTCFTAETWELFKMLYSGSEDNAKIKLEIAERTRTLEIVGFSVSLVALFFSLAIFFRFR